jgi:hypothetical protein
MLQGCMIVALQGCGIVVLQGCVIVVLHYTNSENDISAKSNCMGGQIVQ